MGEVHHLFKSSKSSSTLLNDLTFFIPFKISSLSWIACNVSKLGLFRDNSKGILCSLITLDEILPNSNYDGIKRVNAIEWLLDSK